MDMPASAIPYYRPVGNEVYGASCAPRSQQETITLNPTLKPNSDVEMPALGFGVVRSPPEVTAAAEELQVGCRQTDTVAAHGKQPRVGQGVRRASIDRDPVGNGACCPRGSAP